LGGGGVKTFPEINVEINNVQFNKRLHGNVGLQYATIFRNNHICFNF